MRFLCHTVRMRLLGLLLGSIGLLAACSHPDTSPSCPSVAQGGAAIGGSPASSGGDSANGGTNATSGAATTAGEASSAGGTSANGGTSNAGSSVNAGGATNVGGATARGGGGTGGTASAGGSGATGGAATGGAPACTDQAGSLKPTYPFPQNYRSSKCIYPTGVCSSTAKAAYDQWKKELVVSNGAGGFQRVNRPDQEAGITNSTVSEGIAYGMILAVFMDDQPLFDNLWQYAQLHLNGNKLMIWLIDSNGNPGIEGSGMPASGSATDADEDMAWALALAAQKWGTSATVGSYKSLAVSLIGRIYTSEADTRYDLLNAGDSWGTTFAWNPSYFAPYEYRVFAKLDTAHADGWNKIIDKGYQVLAASQNASSGLVPAWTDTSGKPSAAWSGGPTNYQYDAVRVPFRIAIDYCEYGDTRAAAILQKFTTFFSGVGAANIVDGYALDGTPQPEHTSPAGVQSALFVGAAGVGAMSTTNAAFVSGVYQRITTQPDTLMLPVSYYYNLSWKVFTLLIMTGNLFEYSLHP
jgi:endo-1,4-beta-D-glucanase Y